VLALNTVTNYLQLATPGQQQPLPPPQQQQQHQALLHKGSRSNNPKK
jgi:hypothetical protein